MSFDEVDRETLKTQESENLTMINSVNGKLSYRFETPLLERYELASEPYMEFRKGIKVETYNDTTGLVESELVADYAKLIEPQELWEARGNVVAKNSNGQILETEQLFWDQKTDKIYSNVTSKVTQGEDVIVGTGFVSNSRFDNFEFRRPRGQVLVDTEPNHADSLSTVDSLSAPPVPEPDRPMEEEAPESGDSSQAEEDGTENDPAPVEPSGEAEEPPAGPETDSR